MFSGNYLFDIKVLDNGEVFLWQMEKPWKDSDMKVKMVLQIHLPAQQMEPLKLKLPLIDVEFLIIVNANILILKVNMLKIEAGLFLLLWIWENFLLSP